MDVPRPPHISEDDWARMPWYAREKTARRLSVVTRETVKSMPRAPRQDDRARRIRVYRVEPGCWEITDGRSSARTATAEAAWRLLGHLGRTG